MENFLNFIRFTDGNFHVAGAFVRMVLAVICGGLIGIEREYKRRPAGFRTHILICLGASMTTLVSQYLYLEMDMFTDLGRLGAQVIAGIGFIGAGTIIVTRRRQVKGLTTAAGLWVAAIIGLAIGAGYVEAAVLATVMILLVELLLSRLEWFVMSTAKTLNLYVEYREVGALMEMTEYLRTHNVQVGDLQVTKSGADTQNPCAIFSLELPRKMTQDKLMTALAGIGGVVSVEEL